MNKLDLPCVCVWFSTIEVTVILSASKERETGLSRKEVWLPSIQAF